MESLPSNVHMRHCAIVNGARSVVKQIRESYNVLPDRV
jgi:ribose 1,5-bisphosphokinase PhnN